MPQVAALAIAAIGAAVTYKGQKDAAKAEKKRVAAEQRKNNLKSARERRRVAAQTRTTRADIEQSAANTGASTSSAPVGGSASVGSQGQAEQGFLGSVNSLNKEITGHKLSKIKAGQKQALGQLVSTVGSSLYSASGSFGGGSSSSFQHGGGARPAGTFGTPQGNNTAINSQINWNLT